MVELRSPLCPVWGAYHLSSLTVLLPLTRHRGRGRPRPLWMLDVTRDSPVSHSDDDKPECWNG